MLLSALAAGNAAADLVERRTIGGPGRAELYPSGVAINTDGSLVVADTGNDRMVKYLADGTPVWRVGSSGDGVGELREPRDADVDSEGNLYVSDNSNRRIVKLAPNGDWIDAWPGPAADPLLGTPMGIAVRGDSVYVAEPDRSRVRVWNLDLDTQLMSVESDGECAIAKVRDVDTDAAGNLYLANFPNEEVLVFAPDGTCLDKWTADGVYSIRVAYDPQLQEELVYVGKTDPGIQVYRKNGTFIAGMGGLNDGIGDWDDPASELVPGLFSGLRFFNVGPSGEVWAGDLHGYQVQRYDRTQSGWAYTGAIPDPVVAPPLAADAAFNQVRKVAFASDGTLAAVDYYNNRVVRFTTAGDLIRACGNRSSLSWPDGVAIDSVTSDIWVPAVYANGIEVLAPDCTSLATVTAESGGFSAMSLPTAIAIRASDRRAFVTDTYNGRILAIDIATRRPIAAYGVWGTGTGQLRAPSGIGIDPATGHLLVADRNNHRIVELAFDGSAFTWIRAFGTGLDEPRDVAVDAAGRIYVADSGNRRAVVMDHDGNPLATVDGLGFPYGVAVHPDTQEVYISDTDRDLIRVFAWETPGEPACGAPRYDAATDRALFVWRDCETDNWHVRITGGGISPSVEHTGSLVSSQPFASVSGVSLEENDVLDTAVPGTIGFSLRAGGVYQDGFDFALAPGANACFTLSAPADLPVLAGAERVPVGARVALPGFGPCADAPPAVGLTCGAPSYTIDDRPAVYAWQGCGADGTPTGEWSVRLTGGSAGNAVLYTGGIAASAPLAAVVGVDLEDWDLLADADRANVSFELPVIGQDGIDFALAPGADGCFTLARAPAATQVYFGTDRAPGTRAFDLRDGGPCAAAPPPAETPVCGAPSYDPASDGALFLWQDCGSDDWHVRVTGGGRATVSHDGSVVSDAPFPSVAPYALEATDLLDAATPGLIAFALRAGLLYQDGFDFALAAGAEACFTLGTPAGLPVLAGANRVAVGARVALPGFGTCPF